jgi:hypothetical protein
MTIPVICGLSVLGVLSIGLALVEPGDLFVWLHTLAILLGGACFSSGLLAQADNNLSHKHLYFMLVVAVAINI